MLRIYEKDVTAATLSTALATSGLGILTHATRATLHRVINGDWSLALTYPLDAPGAALLTPERLICYADEATGEEQLYRISRRMPRSTRQGRVIDIEAPHVAYDLRHKVIENIETAEDDRYPDGIDARTALGQLLEGTGFIAGEVTVDAAALDYLDILQKDVMTCLKEQLLSKWGGEIAFDNFTIHLKAALGEDRRYPIRDGRNIREITVTEDWDKVVTRLHVRGYDGANFEDVNGGKDYIDSEMIGTYSHVREGYADFPDEDDPEALLALGRKKLAEMELPEITYDISLAQMQGSVQYACYRRLEHFGLGDTAALHTDVLNRDVLLRCTELETDCLTGRNTEVALGNTDKELLSAITAGASASDRLAGVLTPEGYLQAEKLAGRLNLVRIQNLAAEIARIASVEIGKADITSAQIRDLSATMADILKMDVDWASITSLSAEMAKVASAKIASADIDFAKIKDLFADKQIITQGEAGELYIADLRVTEANMVSLTVGELVLRDKENGGFVVVRVDDEGNLYTTPKKVDGSDLADGSVDGSKILEDSIQARHLDVKEIFADNATIRILIAANLDVDTLFAREAMAGKITTNMLASEVGANLVISGGRTIAMLAGDVDEMRSVFVVDSNGTHVKSLDGHAMVSTTPDGIRMVDEQGVLTTRIEKGEMETNKVIAQSVKVGRLATRSLSSGIVAEMWED